MRLLTNNSTILFLVKVAILLSLFLYSLLWLSMNSEITFANKKKTATVTIERIPAALSLIIFKCLIVNNLIDIHYWPLHKLRIKTISLLYEENLVEFH